MSKLSRQCIDAIKSAAIANPNTQINVSQVIRDKSIIAANPHCYVQDAINELRDEGYNIKCKGRVWYVSNNIEENQPKPTKTSDQIIQEYVQEAKIQYDPGEPTVFVPVKQKQVAEQPEIKSNPEQFPKANLNFVDVEFENLSRLIGMISSFNHIIPPGAKVMASLKIKVLNEK